MAQLIAGMIASDDDVAHRESQLLQRVLAELGLPPDARGKLFPVIDPREAAEQIGKLAPEVQSEALRLLIDAAAADGKIATSERRYLSAVARAAGIDDAELERLVADRLTST